MKTIFAIAMMICCVNSVFSQTIEERLNHGIEKNKAHNFGDAITEFNGVITMDPTNTDAFFLRGTAKMLLDEDNDALTDLNRALDLKKATSEPTKMMPNNSCIYCHLGNTNAKLDRPATAISFYSKSIEANPKRGETFYRRALSKLLVGQKEEARLDLKKAEELNYKQASEALKSYFP